MILPDIERVDVDVATKLKEIGDGGIPVVFLKQVPGKQPGYLDFAQKDAYVMQLCERVAGRLESRVQTPDQLVDYLVKRGVTPGVHFLEVQPAIHYTHRHTDDADYYFLRHSRREPVTFSATFPHARSVPYVLDAWTGEVSEAAQYERLADGLRMRIDLPAYGSTMLAMAEGDPTRHVTQAPMPVVRDGDMICARSGLAGTLSLTLDDGTTWKARIERNAPPAVAPRTWRLDAQLRAYDGSHKPVSLDLSELADWREIELLRFCSAKGTYTTTFRLGEEYVEEGLSLELDLGRVHDVAEIEINGHALAPLLVYPYTADVTPFAKVGRNELKVAITPALRNRLVGYGKAGIKACRHLKGRELSPSGLIGPVELRAAWSIRLSSDAG